ncbi:MAG: NAD-dependent epimerase/dehydratase family protein, partial [Proteobacteria bacterium]|nr:NAD-dependent epimerase/dehydratase family protein [Pseudomonadota bacterium]
GTGFIGQHTAKLLTQNGWHVILAARTQPANLPPKTTFLPCNAIQSIPPLPPGCAVVNLIGILTESPAATFPQAHVQVAQNIAQAAAQAKASAMVQVSALGASLHSPSRYAQTKAQGEHAVHQAYPQATILRPSLVLGEGNDFARRMLTMAKFSPILPLPGMGRTLFQPINVTAVAHAIAHALENPQPNAPQILVGPQVLSFRQLLQQTLQQANKTRLLLPLPFWASTLIAHMLTTLNTLSGHRLPTWLLLTPDQVTLLKTNNIA